MWIAFLWLGFAVDLLSSYLPPLPTLSFNANMFRNPGSVATILVILILVAILVIAFIYLHWRQDTLFPLLVGYIAFFVVYGVLPSIVGLSIHLVRRRRNVKQKYDLSLLLSPIASLHLVFTPHALE